MADMDDASRSRPFLVTFDLLLLAGGIALLFVASVNGLGLFLCAAAGGLLILTTRPKLFKFYLLGWGIIFVVLLFMVSRHYRDIQRNRPTMRSSELPPADAAGTRSP